MGQRASEIAEKYKELITHEEKETRHEMREREEETGCTRMKNERHTEKDMGRQYVRIDRVFSWVKPFKLLRAERS